MLTWLTLSGKAVTSDLCPGRMPATGALCIGKHSPQSASGHEGALTGKWGEFVWTGACMPRRACMRAWCACRLENKFMELVLSSYCGFLELHSGVRLVHNGFSKQ